LMGYTELNFYVFSIHGRWMDYFHRMSTHGRLALGSSSIFFDRRCCYCYFLFYSFGGFKINI
jgi:hypothetical protein